MNHRTHMHLNFEWDPLKAQANLRKHRISFERAAKVFLDPHALTVFDEAHSDSEDRWVTIGLEESMMLVVVCHTFIPESDQHVQVRIFSARKATKSEIQQYGRMP